MDALMIRHATLVTLSSFHFEITRLETRCHATRELERVVTGNLERGQNEWYGLLCGAHVSSGAQVPVMDDLKIFWWLGS